MEQQGKDVSVAQRQIYILSLLSENPKGYQASEIRQRLKNWDIEVSQRTITRDIDELSLNYAIGEEERGGKTYYYADKYTLKNVDFTIEDLAALAFAKEVLSGFSNLHMGKQALAMIDKIVEGSAALNQKQFEKLCGNFAKNHSNHLDSVNPEVERKLQNAIDNQNKIQIEYYSYSSDECTTRIVHPYQILLIDSYLCIEGFCELRKEVRRFRVSRIEELEVLDSHFDIPAEVLREIDNNKGFLYMSGGEREHLQILFQGESARYVKEYEGEKADRLESREAGLLFCKDTAVTPDVIRWIRGFGEEAVVIEPAWLTNMLKEEAKRIAEKE